MKRQIRIGPLCFQAGCRKRQLNLDLVFCLFCVVVHFFWLMNACFCCVRFSFTIPSQEIGLENVSEMTYFVPRETWNLNSISQSISHCSKPWFGAWCRSPAFCGLRAAGLYIGCGIRLRAVCSSDLPSGTCLAYRASKWLLLLGSMCAIISHLLAARLPLQPWAV